METLIKAVLAEYEDQIFRCPDCGLEEEISSPRLEGIIFTEKGILCPDCLSKFLLTKVPVMVELEKKK